MPLINCPECAKEISNKATNCPNCGNPIKQKSVLLNKNKNRFSTILKWFSIIEFAFSVICAIYFSGLGDIPTWMDGLSPGAAKLAKNMTNYYTDWEFFYNPPVFFYWLGAGVIIFLIFYGLGTIVQLLDDKRTA